MEIPYRSRQGRHLLQGHVLGRFCELLNASGVWEVPIQITTLTQSFTWPNATGVWNSHTDQDTDATFCKARCSESMESSHTDYDTDALFYRARCFQSMESPYSSRHGRPHCRDRCPLRSSKGSFRYHPKVIFPKVFQKSP